VRPTCRPGPPLAEPERAERSAGERFDDEGGERDVVAVGRPECPRGGRKSARDDSERELPSPSAEEAKHEPMEQKLVAHGDEAGVQQGVRQ
jgi:hypothetical protein